MEERVGVVVGTYEKNTGESDFEDIARSIWSEGLTIVFWIGGPALILRLDGDSDLLESTSFWNRRGD